MPITTLFLDLGGVLLTNGWGRRSRRLACEQFGLDFAEMDERHHLSFNSYEDGNSFNSYEDGKLTLDQYLDQVVFNEPRPFSKADFIAFMTAQSQPLPDMLDYVRALKQKHHLQLVVVSNEGRELTAHRISTFALRDLIDVFVVSSFVHYRKPDHDIYLLALDVSQAPIDKVVYIDDRALFIEVARGMGIASIQHSSVAETAAALAEYGLALE
jgi:putative hydrolase of the HAD superfamily